MGDVTSTFAPPPPRAAEVGGRCRTIVQVVINLGKGGMEAIAVNLARGLDRTRFRPILIALDAGGEHEEELRDAGIAYSVLGTRRWRDPRFHWTLWKLLRRLQPDVVHTHHFSPLLHTVSAARLASVPRLVHTEHSWQYLEHRPAHRWALRWMSRLSDAFVVVGSSMAPYYRDHVQVAPEQLRVIPNGIDTRVFRPLDRLECRRALGWPDTDRVVLFAADPEVPVKRFPLAEEACRRAQALFGPLRLEVAWGVTPDEMPRTLNAAECVMLASHTQCS